MRNPSWESSPGALAALLNGCSNVGLFMIDLYTLSRGEEVLARWTSADRDIAAGGHLWTQGPLIERDTVRFVVGIEVDSLSVTLTPAQSGTEIGSVPLLQFAARRGFDGCRLRIDRAYSTSPDTEFAGALILFDGRVSEAKVTRRGVELSVKSDLELLDAQVPRTIYQAGCANVCYDAACGLQRVEHVTTVTRLGERRRSFGIDLRLASGDYFALGTVEFRTGKLAGTRRSIRASTGALVTLMAPLPEDPMPGDEIVLVRGCARTMASCAALGNSARFRGCPFIPKPETVL